MLYAGNGKCFNNPSVIGSSKEFTAKMEMYEISLREFKRGKLKLY